MNKSNQPLRSNELVQINKQLNFNKINIMLEKTTNEYSVINSNQPYNQNLVIEVDKLVMERLLEHVNDELEWIYEYYGNDEISNFLDGEDYYLESPLLEKLDRIYHDLIT